MGALQFFRRLDRAVGRFNDWFSGAAVAASAAPSPGSNEPPVSAMSVNAALGELERESDARTRPAKDD